MRLGIVVPALVVSLFIIILGCTKPEKKELKPLATVNGVPILKEDLYLRVGSHGDSAALKDRALDDVINEELLYQKGVQLGLDKDQKFQNAVRLLERRVVAYKRGEISRRVKNSEIAAKVNVTDEDIKDYYDKHTAEIGDDLHLGILQFQDEEQAKDALDKLRGGTPFEKIAVQLFHVQNGQKPWDRGFLHWNQIPNELLDSVYQLKKGDVSEVINAGAFGFYLIELIDRKKNQNAALESMKAGIMNRLNSIKIAEAHDRYIEQLRKESRIKKFDTGK